MGVVGVLGPVEVGSVPVAGPRLAALVGMLALDAGQAISADVLIDRLWADERRPADPAGALHQQVFKARRALGDAGAVERVGAGYRLTGADVDAADFERRVAMARRRLAAAPGDAADAVSAALGLWRGRPLDGVTESAWMLAEVRRLEELRLHARELRADALLRAGQHDLAARELRAVLDDDPLRESAWEALLRALDGSGRQAEALSAFRTARKRLVEDLGIEPGPELRRTHTAILRRAPSEDLVGRDTDLGGVLAALDGRLVTLTGPAGVGKTTLALAAAARLDAVHVVELAPLTSADEVLPAIGRVLGAPDPAAVLRDTAAVLVLDNAEHVTAAAPAIRALLDRAPATRILATSRVPLGVEEETVLAVEPLGPADAEALLRLRAPDSDGDLATLAQRLDGLPLAIELAAARLRHLSVEELGERLDARLGILKESRAVGVHRHWSLRTALDLSHDLLAADERAVLARMSVFATPAELDTIECVCGDGTLDALSELVDASLVRRSEHDGRSRYGMLETIREYGRDRLRESGDEAAVRDRHAAAMLAFVARARPFVGASAPDYGWMARRRKAFADVDGAIEWSLGRGDGATALRLVAGLRREWVRGGRLAAGLAWVERALPLVEVRDARTRLLTGQQWIFRVALFETDAAVEAGLEQLLGDALACGDAGVELEALGALAMLHGLRQDFAPSRAVTERLLGRARSLGNTYEEIMALSDLTYDSLCLGDPAEALRTARAAVALSRHANIPEPGALHYLGLSLLADAEHAAAADALLECARVSDEINYVWTIGYALDGLAAALAPDRPEDGVRLLAAATRYYDGLDGDREHYEQALYDRTADSLRAQVGDAAFARLWAEGARLDVATALTLAE